MDDTRPSLHFTPPSGWMNDPNGTVYFDGEYHLFYQYHPHNLHWGPMHWGHAVSPDMHNWTHLPIALRPQGDVFAFSGSAVIDWQNTSGLGDGKTPPLVCIYTAHDAAGKKAGTQQHESQAIACSLDGGRTWRPYEGNPVLPNPGGMPNFRDPKVIWHQPSKRWIMTVAASDRIAFFASTNLTSWTHLSDFGPLGATGGVWECPDLVALTCPVSGDTFWVLIVSLNPGGPAGGSGTQYFLGDFDGKHFVLAPGFQNRLAEEGPQWIDWGPDNYAGVTWSDRPASEPDPLFISWMSNWQYADKLPATTSQGSMSLPRTLHVHPFGPLPRLAVRPAILRHGASRRPLLPARIASSGPVFELTQQPVVLDVEIDLASRAAWPIELRLTSAAQDAVSLRYDPATERFMCSRGIGRAKDAPNFSGRFEAPRLMTSSRLPITICIDHSSVELFIDDGLTSISLLTFQKSAFDALEITGPAQNMRVSEIEFSSVAKPAEQLATATAKRS
jgi:fructan beta-fructosidase